PPDNAVWDQGGQPGLQGAARDIVAQGIAYAREGAAIIHVHAYDESSGLQRDDPDIYARIIEGIRASVDCIVYPTIPGEGSMPASERFAAIEELGRRGLLEWAVVDPGSVNIGNFV